MLSEKVISAKKVMEHYIDKMHDMGTKESVFSAQYANLHVLRFRIQSVLNSLESYNLEVKVNE
jgi:hypothetical protein